MKIGVVIPTIRPEQFHQWLDNFKANLSMPEYQCTLYVCEDNPKKTFEIPEQYFTVRHYDWSDIDEDLGEDSWIIPRRSDVIRSYGFLKAYNDSCDYVLTFDDDVRITEGQDIIGQYLEGFADSYNISGYADVGNMFGIGEHMRGFPFKHRKFSEAWVQYGGWHNVPDYDAVTQSQTQYPTGHRFKNGIQPIPKHMGVTCCIMNAAFDRRAIPFAYQLLQGEHGGYPYDRWGDIWSGLFIKRILDHLDKALLINGNASVTHTRASDVRRNLEKECSGYGVNETLWENLLSYILHDMPKVADSYEELSSQLRCNPFTAFEEPYQTKLSKAMRVWASLFEVQDETN